MDHRLIEAVEVVDRREEGPGAADHIVSTIFGEAAGRIGVQREISALRGGGLVEDGETVDRRAGGDRRVARVGRRAAVIIGAVARHVDDAAIGGKAAQASRRTAANFRVKASFCALERRGEPAGP
jgi:hypothetical protein